MKTIGLVLLGFCVLPLSAQAFFTNSNFLTSEHAAPAWFELDGAGGFYGALTTGTLFTQKPITNDFGLKLHKFVIDDAWFYISDRGTIEAETDLMALSIYLAAV
jgi:hypothetical protein